MKPLVFIGSSREGLDLNQRDSSIDIALTVACTYKTRHETKRWNSEKQSLEID